MDQSRPLIFDIVRGSMEDGNGIRTVLFLKGCPLRCVWCHNPESQEPGPEKLSYPDRCINCENCRRGRRCYSDVEVTVGRYYHPDEVADLCLRDSVFYTTSGGGVTFSGGEPLLFIDYLTEIARTLHRHGIHVLIETAGAFDFDLFEHSLLPLTDTLYFDLKLFDEALHRKYTGAANRLILDNFERALTSGIEVVPRIPLVPEITATSSNLTQIARYLKKQGVLNYVLLPYNSAGQDKLKPLGRCNSFPVPDNPMSLQEVNRWRALFDKAFQGEN